jgi:hypothetical protein
MPFIRTPLEYSPANNPVIFSMSGTSSQLVYFRTELIDSKTLNTVYTGNVFPTPLSPTVGTINLSKQLGSLVRADVDNDDEIVLEKITPITSYKVKTTEYGVTGGTLSAVTSSITSDTFYAWEAGLDILNWTNEYDSSKYVMQTGGTGSFLTFQPDNKCVNEYSTEQLYFIQKGLSDSYAVIEKNGTKVLEFVISGTTPYLISPAIPEVLATATITINGTGNTGDNGGYFIDSNLIGDFTIPISGLNTTQIASGLKDDLEFDGSGFEFTRGTNVITVTAPVGSGAAGNSYFAEWNQLVFSATTSGGTSGTTAAIATVTGYALPYLGATAFSQVDDPVLGFISLASFSVTATNLNDYTQEVVDEINTNPYSYSATKLSTSSFRVTAPTSLGSSINGVAHEYYDDDNRNIIDIFSGGASGGGTTGTTYYDIIDASVTQFTGGTDAIDAVYGLTLADMYRLQIAPKHLTGTTFSNNDKIGVYISGSTGILSEKQYYKYCEAECNINYMNVLFTNSLGGLDSVQMVEPQITNSGEKKSIKRNNLNIDSTTPYVTSGVFNKQIDIYNVVPSTTVKAFTKQLTDEESDWLVELFNSKEVYIELSNGQLLPVEVMNNNYSIQKRKYNNKDLIQIQVEFKLPEYFVPSLNGGQIIING